MSMRILITHDVSYFACVVASGHVCDIFLLDGRMQHVVLLKLLEKCSPSTFGAVVFITTNYQ